MKNILKIAAAAGIMLGGSAALAQSGNGSDVTGPSIGSTLGGTFAPTPTGSGGAVAPSPSAAPAVGSTGARFNSGAPVTSPITGTTIPAASVAAVGSLITGSGGAQAIATVGAGLTAGGASPAAVANLTSALAALANVTSASAPGAIVTAAKAYNALVASVPAGFFTSNNGGPPSMLLAVQAALAPMVASIGH